MKPVYACECCGSQPQDMQLVGGIFGGLNVSDDLQGWRQDAKMFWETMSEIVYEMSGYSTSDFAGDLQKQLQAGTFSYYVKSKQTRVNNAHDFSRLLHEALFAIAKKQPTVEKDDYPKITKWWWNKRDAFDRDLNLKSRVLDTLESTDPRKKVILDTLANPTLKRT